MLTIIRKSGQTVSTRLASEIASKLATGLMRPITAQLDPHRIGIAQRGLEVTKVYGRQIANVKNLKTDADTVVEHLVKDYPTHAFVIDKEEAGSLFENVDSFSETEEAVFNQLRSALIRPADLPFIVNFASVVELEASNKQKKEKQETGHAETEQPDRADTAGSDRQSNKPAARSKPNGRSAPKSDPGEPGTFPSEHIA
jgi:hypothetical protein